jgi:hypothetical protein
MTRSHALLHCPNATLAAARVEAWEGRNPKAIGILLSSPRWESRLLRFLELSGVGRYVEEGVDEDQAHAEKMDEWTVWEAEEEGARRSPGLLNRHHPSLLFFRPFRFLTFVQTCKGGPYPAKGAQRKLGAEDFFCCGSYAGAAAGSFCKVHIPIRGEGHKTRIKQTKQTIASGTLVFWASD